MKAIIFDFNGTMVFDSLFHDEAWRQMSKKLRNKDITDEEFLFFHGAVNEKLVEYLLPGTSPEDNVRISIEKEALYRDIARQDEAYRLVKGLESFLDTIADTQIKLNLASASIKDNIDFFVSHFHLDTWFDPVNICYDDGTYKDKVEMYKDAAKMIGVEMKDCLVFEDSITGIKSAKKAGAHSIIGIHPTGILEHEDASDDVLFVIKDFTDERLQEVLKK